MEVPCPILTFPGPETVKLGAETVRGNAVVEEIFPDVAVTVTELMPVAAELPAVSVNVLFTPEEVDVRVAGLGDMEAVTPLGKPETESATLPLKPYLPRILRVLELVVPCPMLAFGGPEIEMDGGDMVKEKVAVEVTFPDVPVMVRTVVPNETELLDERVK